MFSDSKSTSHPRGSNKYERCRSINSTTFKVLFHWLLQNSSTRSSIATLSSSSNLYHDNSPKADYFKLVYDFDSKFTRTPSNFPHGSHRSGLLLLCETIQYLRIFSQRKSRWRPTFLIKSRSKTAQDVKYQSTFCCRFLPPESICLVLSGHRSGLPQHLQKRASSRGLQEAPQKR